MIFLYSNDSIFQYLKRYSILENKNKLYDSILKDTNLYEVFKNDIYYKNTVLEKMENLLKMDKKSSMYDKIYQQIIQVGEFDIPDYYRPTKK